MVVEGYNIWAPSWKAGGIPRVSTRFSLRVVWRMSRLTRDGTAEPASRDQILRRERGQGKLKFSCSSDHEQYWQPFPVELYSAICNDHKHNIITAELYFFSARTRA